MISDIEKNRNNNIICYFQNRVKGKDIGTETPPPTTATVPRFTKFKVSTEDLRVFHENWGSKTKSLGSPLKRLGSATKSWGLKIWSLLDQ